MSNYNFGMLAMLIAIVEFLIILIFVADKAKLTKETKEIKVTDDYDYNEPYFGNNQQNEDQGDSMIKRVYTYHGVRYWIRLMYPTHDERKYNSSILFYLRGFVEGEQLSDSWCIYGRDQMKEPIKKIKEQAKIRIKASLNAAEYRRIAIKEFKKETK